MAISPSVQTLNRDASTQQLPPKPRLKKKNTMQGTLITAEMYQSITSHPTVLKQSIGTTSGKKSVGPKQYAAQREAFSPIRRNQFVASSQPNLRGLSSGRKEQKSAQKKSLKASQSQKHFSPVSKHSAITSHYTTGNQIINIPSQGLPQNVDESQISEGFNDRRLEEDLETARNAHNIANQASKTKNFQKVFTQLKTQLQETMKRSNDRQEQDQIEREIRRKAKQERMAAIQANRQKQTQDLVNQMKEIQMKNKKLEEKKVKEYPDESERLKKKEKLQKLKDEKRKYFTECQQAYKEQMKQVEKKTQKIKCKQQEGEKQILTSKQADQVLFSVPSAPHFDSSSFNRDNELSSISNDMHSKNIQPSSVKKIKKGEIKFGKGNPKIQELIKQQKRERSEKRKVEELQEREKSEKRKQNLIQLQNQYGKKFSNFKKHNGLPTGRVLPSKKMIRDKSKSTIAPTGNRARSKVKDEEGSGRKKKSQSRHHSKEGQKVTQLQKIAIAQILSQDNGFGKRVNSESNLIKSIDALRIDKSQSEFQALLKDAMVKQSLNVESIDRIIKDDKRTDKKSESIVQGEKTSSHERLQSLSDKSSGKKSKKTDIGIRQSIKSYNDMVTIGTPGSTQQHSPQKGKKKPQKNAIPNKKMKSKKNLETPLSLPLQQQIQQFAMKLQEGISVSQLSKKEISNDHPRISTSKSTNSLQIRPNEARKRAEAATKIQAAYRGKLGRQAAQQEKQFQSIQNRFKRNKNSPPKTENRSPEKSPENKQVEEKHWDSPKQTSEKKIEVISVSRSEQNLKKILEKETKNKTSSVEFSKLGYKYQEASEKIIEEEKALSKQSSKKPSGQKERPQSASQDFDSMSSKNKNTQELDMVKDKQKKGGEGESKTESFIMQMMHDKPKRQRVSSIVPLSDRSKSHHTIPNQLHEGDSWHFGGSRFQDEFPEEKSSRRVIPNQLSLAQRVKEEELRIEILDRKTQKKQLELEVLRKKPALSPQSRRKMLALEKRVSKYQQEIEIGKQSQAQISNIIDQLASGKKFLANNLFNSNRKHSFLDQSSDLSQSNISIHSTPRVPIQALKQVPAASMAPVPQGKKPFAYGEQEKVSSFISPEPDSSRKILEISPEEKPQEKTEEKKLEVQDFGRQNQILAEGSPSLILSDIKMVRGYEDANDEKRDVDALASAFQEKEESPKAVDESENESNSSLSQMEQPDFAQNKQKKKEDLLILDADSSPVANRTSPLVAEQSLKSPAIPEQPLDLEDIFLSLREPESTGKLSVEQMNRLADELTAVYVKAFLVELEQNMFPARVMLPCQKPQVSPASEQSAEDQIVDTLLTQPSQSPKSVQEKREEMPQKPLKLRGIDTSKQAVDAYMRDVFVKLREQEDKFVEDLSTPLNKDPEEILMHLQNIMLDPEQETAFSFQQSVLPVTLYLDIEKAKVAVKKEQLSGFKLMTFEVMEPESESVQAEWENIHNKVLFDAVNEALDNFRPYGLRGPPLPWSQQTKTLTYRNGQQVELVVKQVQQKVFEWSRTFAGALPCSELLLDYGIEGALDEERLNHLREERLALLLASEIEENEVLWTDYEYETTQTKLDLADMVLETLAEEAILLLMGKDPAEALKPKKAPAVQVQDHASSNAVGARSPDSSAGLELTDLAQPNVSQRSA